MQRNSSYQPNNPGSHNYNQQSTAIATTSTPPTQTVTYIGLPP
ncbi:hypothetical protein [Limnospira platensis]